MKTEQQITELLELRIKESETGLMDDVSERLIRDLCWILDLDYKNYI